MATVLLGNAAPLDPVKPDENVAEVESHPLKLDNGRDDNWTFTTYEFPPSTPLGEALQQVEAIWHTHHSAALPVWIDSEDGALAEVLARSFSRGEHTVLVGQPKGWMEEGAAGAKKEVADAVATAHSARADELQARIDAAKDSDDDASEQKDALALLKKVASPGALGGKA